MMWGMKVCLRWRNHMWLCRERDLWGLQLGQWEGERGDTQQGKPREQAHWAKEACLTRTQSLVFPSRGCAKDRDKEPVENKLKK